jgi:hypothetical protein
LCSANISKSFSFGLCIGKENQTPLGIGLVYEWFFKEVRIGGLEMRRTASGIELEFSSNQKNSLNEN